MDGRRRALLKAYNESCANKSYLFKLAAVSSYRAGGVQHPYLVTIFGIVRMFSYELSMAEPLPT